MTFKEKFQTTFITLGIALGMLEVLMIISLGVQWLRISLS